LDCATTDPASRSTHQAITRHLVFIVFSPCVGNKDVRSIRDIGASCLAGEP
jgi:hypothetical protein